jgi:hypothetical protein
MVSKGHELTPVDWGITTLESPTKAFWFKFPDTPNNELYVQFNHYPLKTYCNDCVVTATIPHLLERGVGKAAISLHLKKNGELLWQTRFSFQEEWQDPNCFLVGSPRAGTTYISQVLMQHPNIYLCASKEPMFLSECAREFVQESAKTFREYRALFRAAPVDSKIIFEGSAHYLRSRDALTRIADSYANSKIIVCLRNPIAAAVSMHQRNLQGQIYESEPSFEDAWRQSISNHFSRNITNCYSSMFKIGTQLETVFSLFEQNMVHVVTYDDLCVDSPKVIADIVAFLSLGSVHQYKQDTTNGSGFNADLRDYLGDALYEDMEKFFKPEIKKITTLLGPISLAM